MTAGHDITIPFDEPYFGGGGPELDDRSLPVALDGRGFLLDLENPSGMQFVRRSVQLLNTQQSASGLDQSVTAPEVWRRPVESWHMGADQKRLDREDSLPYRFHDSQGIDPWQKFGISLLPDVKTVASFPAGETGHLEAIGDRLLVVHGTTASVYPSVEAQPVDHTLAAAVVDTTADGKNFYVLCANGEIAKCDETGAWTVEATVPNFQPNVGMIAYVKGFVIVGNGPALIDYTVPTAPITVMTHRLPGWWWRSASEGLSVIYVLGGMGDRWHVHSMTIKKNAAALDPPIVAATLPDGEIAYSLATYLGYVLIGVNSGWRFGMPESSGAITYGRVIETAGPVRCFEGQDRFVWFGLSILSLKNAKAQKNRTIYTHGSGLGRADLSVFVAPMTPAAASDLAGPNLGETTAIVSVGGVYDGFGRRVFAVSGPNGGHVYVEDDVLVREGWLTSGSMSFNSNDDKMGLYAQVFHEPLRGSISLEIADDLGGIFVERGKNDRAGSVSMGNVPYPVSFHAAEHRYVLHRDPQNPTLGPRITRAEFRAINVPGRATEWRIPLFVHEDQHFRDIQKTRDVVSDYDFLIGLVQTRRQFLYREGERTWNLHAIDFTWMPYRLTSTGNTYQGTFLLIAREIQ